MSRRMRTTIATLAVLVFVLATHDRGSEGRARPADRLQGPATGPNGQAAPPASPRAPAETPVSQQQALLDQYCMGCHSDRVKSGGLALSELKLDAVDQHAEIAEKVIRKLRGGLMPPAGSRRPD